MIRSLIINIVSVTNTVPDLEWDLLEFQHIGASAHEIARGISLEQRDNMHWTESFVLYDIMHRLHKVVAAVGYTMFSHFLLVILDAQFCFGELQLVFVGHAQGAFDRLFGIVWLERLRSC